jgi:hypothetical protein
LNDIEAFLTLLDHLIPKSNSTSPHAYQGGISNYSSLDASTCRNMAAIPMSTGELLLLICIAYANG